MRVNMYSGDSRFLLLLDCIKALPCNDNVYLIAFETPNKMQAKSWAAELGQNGFSISIKIICIQRMNFMPKV